MSEQDTVELGIDVGGERGGRREMEGGREGEGERKTHTHTDKGDGEE